MFGEVIIAGGTENDGVVVLFAGRLGPTVLDGARGRGTGVDTREPGSCAACEVCGADAGALAAITTVVS